MRGIYKITNTKNNKVYIGLSINLRSRIKYHKRQLEINLHYNKELQKDYNKHGKTYFNYEVIEKVKTEDFNIEELREKEKEYIKFYKSNNPQYGYNKSKGGEIGVISEVDNYD